MNETICQRCGAHTQMFLCPSCVNRLRDLLTQLGTGGIIHPDKGAVEGQAEELENEALGKSRKGASARRSSDTTTPLMMHVDASAILRQANPMLIEWMRDICETRRQPVPFGEQRPTPAQCGSGCPHRISHGCTREPHDTGYHYCRTCNCIYDYDDSPVERHYHQGEWTPCS